MALIDIWVNKINDKDVVDADDINNIASAVINIENQEQSIVKTTEQTFTNEQKAQARNNIDVPSNEEVRQLASNFEQALSVNAVLTKEQALTDEQKAQARENIGAVSAAEAQTALQNLATAIEPHLLPSATTADNDKFLQVVDGKATWVTIALAEDGGF